ncbi:MAG: hypothetical protein OXF85_02260 [Candidatus Saccharibacteria bacterium]|nr:hypothetical protein [Candidatus Saccharibacteria bacterium]
MEEEINNLEQQIVKLEAQKQTLIIKKPHDLAQIKAKLKHLLNYLDQVIKQRMSDTQSSSC